MSRSEVRFALGLAVLLSTGCSSTRPTAPAPAQLALGFAVIDNHHNGPESFRAQLTLTHRGGDPLGRRGWELYFNFGRQFHDDSLPKSVTVTHVNGDLFKLTPTRRFPPLGPGESLTIPFEAEHWIIKEVEAPAGAYLVFTDGNAVRPPVAVEVTVAPFLTRRQADRHADDKVPVPTPASRFEDNRKLTLLPPDQVPRIVPTPLDVRRGGGRLSLDAGWTIDAPAELDGEARYLAAALEPRLGGRLDIVRGGEVGATSIVLELDDVDAETEGAYRLSIRAGEGVVIAGHDAAGVFYGVQSLRAWLPVAAYGSAADEITVDEVEVDDAPRFPYRGLHLDVARNFHSKATVEKLLDLMAFYKLNRFHFHLSDDEGWRLEIPSLPELTEVGARRGHTTDERDHLVPSFGSGPDPDRSHGSGHYTRAEFVELLRYAHARHIEVIPEIDVPGHARAAIKSMEARYVRLMEEGREAEAREYLLSDSGDRSRYMSVQMWRDNVVDVCLESTYAFLETVIDELMAMYAEAGAPLRRVHTGGDEVPRGVWEASPACERRIRESAEIGSVDELAGIFLLRMSDMLRRRGLDLAGWEEVALLERDHGGETVKTVHPDFAERGFKPYVWNSVWGWGGEDLAYRLANAGYEIVMSNATHLYFDLAYDKDPVEPGLYWAGFTDTRQPWELVPLDVFKNARHDLFGHPLPAEAIRGRVRLTEAGRRNVLGIQGQLWAENSKGATVLEYLAFPKVLGLAERAWAASPAWADEEDAGERQRRMDAAWNVFANSLGQRELRRLDRLYGGVGYRLPPPGAVIDDGRLQANVAFPGLEIRYTTDGSEPTASSELYVGSVEVGGRVKLRSFDTRGRGSRSVVVGESVAQ